MSIDEVVAKRNISSVLHFTTNRGLLGILATKTLKSRLRLNKDEHLKHIFQPNATCRDKDKAWLDYVNLSISRINMGFFNTSSKSWHSEKNFWWSVLDFSPKILNHQGVNFTTTNNIYTGVLRKTGHDGLEAMFADRINQWLGKDIIRPRALDAKFPTCLQAEVLYPKEISTEFLQAIYVQNDEIADEVAGQLGAMNHKNVPIITSPDKFIDMR